MEMTKIRLRWSFEKFNEEINDNVKHVVSLDFFFIYNKSFKIHSLLFFEDQFVKRLATSMRRRQTPCFNENSIILQFQQFILIFNNREKLILV